MIRVSFTPPCNKLWPLPGVPNEIPEYWYLFEVCDYRVLGEGPPEVLQSNEAVLEILVGGEPVRIAVKVRAIYER